MSEPVAYLYGRFVPVSQAAVSIADAGFVLGTTITEQLRTFSGRIFRLEQHLDRLSRSLEILDIRPSLSIAEIGRLAAELAARNHPLLAAGDDLGLGIFVTPGPYTPLRDLAPAGPAVGLYTFPLPFRQWGDCYETGQSLRTTRIEQVSEKCWPRELKVRSRVHYFLADREAAAAEPGARALLLDQAGFVTEATTANLLVYRRDVGLLTPPTAKVLPGITLGAIRELAAAERIAFTEKDLRLEDVATADEVMLCSTSSCVLPMVRLNGQPIGDSRPGPVFRQLLTAWKQLVGVDIAEQAKRFAMRSSG